MADRKYDAVLCDLLTGLLDSWTLWDAAAGGVEPGRRWRMAYLQVTFAQPGPYVSYEDLVAEAARMEGIPDAAVQALFDGYGNLKPWPGVPETLRAVQAMGLPVGIVTNCSIALGKKASAAVGVDVDAVTIAEISGWYKPNPNAYAAGLAALGTTPERTLYVAGSPFDIAGAHRAGMDVFWHNQAGMAPGDGGAPVVMDARRIAPLLDFLS
ncbi:MAG: haloacid dehalogenase [Rhodospirillaceae bacterium]|nr:haloacid dehalogenase [Rhodospirillaceae bacterium]